jgi:hypothetical protein
MRIRSGNPSSKISSIQVPVAPWAITESSVTY